MDRYNTTNQRKGLMKFLLPSVVILLLQNGIAIFFMEIYAVWFSANYPKGVAYMQFMSDLTEALTDADFLSLASLAYAVTGVFLFGFWYKRSKLLDEYRHDDSLKAYPVLLYFGIAIFAVAAQYVSLFVMNVLAYMFPSWLDIYEQLMESAGLSGADGYTIPTILYAVLFGPIVEELCFRGVTYQYARSYLPFWATNIIQALLFGAMHLNPLQSTYAFLLGLAIGAVYEKTRNIYVTIFIHICYNGGGMLLEQFLTFGTSPVTFYLTLFISLCSAYFGYQLITRAEAIRRQRVSATEDSAEPQGED